QVLARVGARHVEAVGVREHGRVAVRAPQDREHLGVGRDAAAVEDGVLVQHAHGHPDRAGEAQALLDRVREQLGPGAYELALLGVAGEGGGAVADQADRGLEARDQQPDRLHDQLGRGEPVALLLGADQDRQQVVGEVAPALLDQLGEVGAERLGGGDRALLDLGRGGVAGEAVRGVGRPDREAVAVGDRHPEQLADQRRGDRQRQVGDHVHRARLERRPEPLGHDLAHPRPPALDGARREGLRHQLAQARVVRRVLLEHELAGALRLRAARQRPVEPPHPAAHPAQQAHAVRVAGQPPRAQGRLVYGSGLAQPMESRIRIVVERRAAQRGLESVPARRVRRGSGGRGGFLLDGRDRPCGGSCAVGTRHAASSRRAVGGYTRSVRLRVVTFGFRLLALALASFVPFASGCVAFAAGEGTASPLATTAPDARPAAPPVAAAAPAVAEATPAAGGSSATEALERSAPPAEAPPPREAEDAQTPPVAAHAREPAAAPRAPDWAPLEMLGETIPPGEAKRLRLESLDSFTAGLWAARGVAPGPTLCVTAGVHGDELNGIAIARALVDETDPREIAGTLIVVPIVNAYGFRNGSRYLPDRRDLNRYFPGRRNGSAAA